MHALNQEELARVAQERPDLEQVINGGMGMAIAMILELEKRCAETGSLLEKSRRVAVPNSRTSHSPPSQDPRPKPRSQRKKSGKKSGGQPGHPGHRLEPVKNPDHVVDHHVTQCDHCDADLRKAPILDLVRKQVFDLPERIRLEITEHRCERKGCPNCDAITTAPAPEGATQPTQYGVRLSAWVIYLTEVHFVPLARTCALIKTLTGACISQGYVVQCTRRLAKNLGPFMEVAKDLLRKSPTVHCDETGIRFLGKRYWLHVCSTVLLTVLLASRSRGRKGINDMGILGDDQQVVISDHLPSYYTIDCLHGACNAHHVRELTFVVEEMGQDWGKRMIRVLWDAKKLKEQYHPFGKLIPEALTRKIVRRYRAALQAGYAVNPAPPPPKIKKRGRPRRGKVLCLLHRLRDREDAVLRCLFDPQVPWDNNQAERDLRMEKVQQKVSGGFRTEIGAEEFAVNRSYLDTMRKQGVEILPGIILALRGKPWLPKGIRDKEEHRKAG